ncbi:MAG: HAMP domain-containing sensor histidine kinase [Bacteroidota bacterium]
MKLSSKLIYFITGSKIAVVLLFTALLPFLVASIASEYTNYSLKDQQKKVLKNISKNGIESYLQGDDNYGSYTMLKEEYISLQLERGPNEIDTIETVQRIVEQDTLSYRVLSYTFKNNGRKYLMEIGKTTGSINQYNKPLQRIALYVLLGLILLTIVADLIVTNVLVSPLKKIIYSKLINRKFPFKETALPVETTTQDFKYLDQSLIALMEQINIDFEKEREFTANASHELMTPISILQTKMENLLADEGINETTAMSIIGMMKTLDRLKKISSSLLLISRIENEQFSKSDELYPLKLLNDIQEEIGHRTNEKGIQMNINLSGTMIIKQVNQGLMFQLFYNLINNAIKYNVPGGRIDITDHRDASGYEIKINDTGVGIAEEELQFIFDRFRKTNLSENAGYGLGLSIVKSIAIYHGIGLNVESKAGKGTVFSVKFYQV